MAINQTVDEDPFDSLLCLEDQFYKAGYELGVGDGEHAGRVEGRSVGLKAGFEKYVAMGRLHGRATMWGRRLPTHVDNVKREEQAETTLVVDSAQNSTTTCRPPSLVCALPANPRLDLHVKTLYALAEPRSLSTDNNEDAVTDFADRLKRAEGKAKVIEKITGEVIFNSKIASKNESEWEKKPKGDGGIEDISFVHALH
ncbi:MAG: hypothetical protein Q9217_003552 [Psora testacea]